MFNPLYHLVFMQIRIFFREPGILFWAIGFPVAMATVLGVAFSSKSDAKRKIAVVSDHKENVVKIFQDQVKDRYGYGEFQLVFLDDTEAEKELKKGKALFKLKEQNGSFELYLDPSNQESLSAALEVKDSFHNKSEAKILPLKVPGTRYIDFLIPGLIAMGIMNSTIWGDAWSIMELRMKKLLRRMSASPMPRYQFLLSFFFSRIFISFIETFILAMFGYYVFHLPFEGSFINFSIIFLTGIYVFTGIAVFAASRAANAQVGNGIINAFTMPMMILSGIFFSYHHFPDWAIESILNFV